MAPVIEVRGLFHRWPGASAPTLAGVDLIVEEGERVGLLGPNGAGKSTLIAHLNGALLAEPPLRVCGQPVDRAHLAAARARVGVVLQDTADQLFMPTVREDVAFGPLNAGLAPSEVARRVAAALDAVGAASLADRPYAALSGGERRRAAIATVLSMDVAVLALDEPTSDLDARGRRAIAGVLRSLPLTQLVATHDLELVREACTRVVVLDGGRIVADGPAEPILADRSLLIAHGVL